MPSAGGDPLARRRDAVSRALRHAPFLADLIQRHPALVEHFIDAGFDATLALVHPWPSPGDDVMHGLRRRRYDCALLIALADLAGDHDLGQTVALLSDFADRCCALALDAAFAERAPGEVPRGIAIIALGKQGSRELNYSSDIDPVLIFDPDTLPHRARDDVGEAAMRIARRWVEILSARTADGYVLRVDLRLRPSPEVTPIILPVDAAIAYYESQALAWEQAAYIRACIAAGDIGLGEGFLAAIRPFIWRSARDFGQLDRIADMSVRIRSHYHGGQTFGPGYDLKRGAGGIREAEFFAQSQQLIHGGRIPALRAAPLPLAYAALAAAGLVAPDLAARMVAHNAILRTIEHRLQMIDDQQTHSLPRDAAALDNVARLHGLADGAALLAMLAPVIAEVEQTFGDLLRQGRASTRWPMEGAALAAVIAASGFPDPADAARRVTDWRSGSARVLRSVAARAALENVLPQLFAALGAAAEPTPLLARFDALISGLPSAINFFHLLGAQPHLLDRLMTILTHAPALAVQLAGRAELIEGLIDSSVFMQPPSLPDLVAELRDATRQLSYEELLDRVRRDVGERRFSLGAQLVEGATDPLSVARGYADVAEAALTVLTDATVAAFEAQHGRVPGGELLVLALGRLGGQALTHASDLDLILLFTGDYASVSDGPRALGATTYFNRLGQRVIAALSVATAAGPLYDVDTRLRPQGHQGPLVASLDAFARYQREDAWTWEHLALTRARVLFGSMAARGAVQTIIDAVLRRPRDHGQLVADAAKMRSDIRQHKPAHGPQDVKLIAGGLVDLEFAIHVSQLGRHIGLVPQLDAALDALIAADIAPPLLRDAHRLLTAQLVCLRLIAPDLDLTDPLRRAKVAELCGCEDWATLDAQTASARMVVLDWRRTLGLDDAAPSLDEVD